MSQKKEEQQMIAKENQSHNKLYQLIYVLTHKGDDHPVADAILMVAGMVIYVGLFLSSVGIVRDLMVRVELGLVLVSLLGLMVLQIVIGVIYLRQFHLVVQFKAYRYLLLPLLMKYLVQLCQEAMVLGMVGIVMVFGVSMLLIPFLGWQQHSIRSIHVMSFPINFYSLIYEMLFLINLRVHSSSLGVSLCGIMLVVSVVNRLKWLGNVGSGYEGRLLAITGDLHIYYAINLLWNQATNQRQGGVNSAMLIGMMAVMVVGQLVDGAQVDESALEILQPCGLKPQEFVERVEYLVEDIARITSSQNPSFSGSFVIAFCYQHHKKCTLPYCKLLVETKNGILANLSDTKVVKELINMVCKKIQKLFEEALRNQPENKQLRISMLKFESILFKNKTRMAELLSEMECKSTTLFKSIQIYMIRKIVTSIQTSQSVNSLKLDECLSDFQNKMFFLINFMMEFWSQFFEERVDLSKLLLISEKIYPYKKMVESIAQRQLFIENYTTLKMLKLYAEYCSVILNEQMRAEVIHDYIGSLSQKLIQKKQLGYLSADSEVGVISISLSEDKLGSIIMVNQQIGGIFGYTRRELIKKKVNQIMPKLISNYHDQILTQFLKNRNKRINSNERQLFGKAKDGYIFPLILQLQKMCGVGNEELIFVALIKKPKKTTEPIMCITTQDGNIEDYSRKFRKLLLKRNTKIAQNIQEIIPEFFVEIASSAIVDYYTIYSQILTKKGLIDFTFKVEEISLAFQKNIGYILRGEIKDQTNQMVTFNTTQMKLQVQINSSSKVSSSKSFKHHHNTSIMWQPEKLMGNMLNLMNISDDKDQKDKKKYDNNIRTIRLVVDHFERVEEDNSFQSEIYDEIDMKRSITHKLEQFKEGLTNQEEDNFIVLVKVFLIIITISFIVLACSSIFTTLSNHQIASNIISMNIQKLIIRNLLSEYIVYYSAANFNQSLTAIYATKKANIQKQLILQLNTAKIRQDQKQWGLKVVFLQDKVQLNNAASNSSFIFDIDTSTQSGTINTLWVVLFVFLGLQMIVLIYGFIQMNKKLYEIFSVFLTLEEKTVRRVYDNCSALAKMVEKETNKFEQMTTMKSNHEFEDDESPVQKIKKFKNTRRSKDNIIIAKLLTPTIICVFCLTGLIIQTQQQNLAQKQKILLNRYSYQVISQSSIHLMNTFIKTTTNQPLNITNNFQEIIYNLESNVQLLETNPNSKSIIYRKMFDNVCQLSNLPGCSDFLGGLLKGGISKGINYLYTTLNALNDGKYNTSVFNDIIKLEYQIIKPVLLSIAALVKVEIDEGIANSNFILKIFTIIIVLSILVGNLYLYHYPLEQMKSELQFSKQLIKMIPQISNPTSNGYSNI